MVCLNCKREVEIHAKGLCYHCYRKISWKPKKIVCKRCGKEKSYHAKGLCDGCYNSVFHVETVKAFNLRKYFNLNLEEYKKLTKECAVCGFDKIVDLHHLDHDKSNNSLTNLVPICPNHHRMLHSRNHRKEVCVILERKDFKVPEGYADDSVFK